mgnify:CR=1 FL=1|jgi:hypothetical protein
MGLGYTPNSFYSEGFKLRSGITIAPSLGAETTAR